MSINDIILNLSKLYVTTDQAAQEIMLASEINDSINTNSAVNSNAILLNFFSERLSKDVKTVQELLSGLNVKELLDLYIDHLKNIKVATITLAFDPDLSYLKQLHSEIVLFLNEQVLLNVLVDSKIVAGIIVEFDGNYIDLSIESKINKFLTKDYVLKNIFK